ncbi:MAG: heme NO-binding domain-containing protein [Cypionkella sp.]
MLGLINRSIQCFLRDSFGPLIWHQVAFQARLGFDDFEPMLSYDDEMTERLIVAAAAVLQRPREVVLEDLGTYLVSHPNVEALRRLLRFGGVGFVDFLHSLEDLPERGRLALPDLELPLLEVCDLGQDDYLLRCAPMVQGVGHVMVGLLRAMADDYGALVLLEHGGDMTGDEVVRVRILDQRHTAGRRFKLALGAG